MAEEQKEEQNVQKEQEKIPEEKKEQEKSKAIKKADNSLQKLSVIQEIAQLEEFAKYVRLSALAPETFASTKDVVAALMMGNEIGIKPMTALQNIHLINGKPGLSVGLYTSKMLENNIIYTIVKDYEKENFYKDDKGNEYSHLEIVNNLNLYHIHDANKLEDSKKAKEEGKIIVLYKRTDTFTEIKFEREIKMPSNKYKDMIIVHRIYMSEIDALGLTKDKAGNVRTTGQWVKQPRTMLRTRVLTAGARLIAPDSFIGVYTDVEIRDMNGQTYSYNEEDGKIETIEVEEVK